MMAWSPVLLGAIILLSILSGPSGAGRLMPKLADRKLCADEECSRKRGAGSWGLGVLVCAWGTVVPFSFFSFPFYYYFCRPHFHGCGPSRLCGSRLPFPDHTKGPNCICLLQAEGARAALLGRQCESWEREKGKDKGSGESKLQLCP